MKVERKHKPEVVIPVAAMADIAFLLIIFFLVTSTLVKEAGLDIKLPKAEESQERRQTERNVAIDKNGVVYWNGVRVSRNELEVKIAEAVKRAGSVEKDKVISVKGDEKAPYGAVVSALDIVTKVGGQIALISESGGGDEEPASGAASAAAKEPAAGGAAPAPAPAPAAPPKEKPKP